MNTLPRCVVALVIGLATTLSVQAFELRGFRGVHWGEAAATLRGAVLAQRDGDVACYQREHENLLFGDTALNGVRYCFHHDRLVLVMLDAPVSRDTLSAEFQRTYGKPGHRSPQQDTWGGASSTTLAALAAQGDGAARLTLSVSRIEPEAARRMERLAARESAPRVAAAF